MQEQEKGQSKKGRPAINHTKILNASLQVFLEKGYHPTRIEDIVAKAQTGKGTFYRYFKDKEDIVSTLLDNFFDEIKATLNWVHQNLDEETSLDELFHNEAMRIFHTMQEHKEIAMLLLKEGKSISSGIYQKISRFYSELIEISEKTLEFAMNFKLLPLFNSKIGAICILGAIEQVYFQWLQGELPQAPEKIVLETRKFLERGCGFNPSDS